jgi:hypothetical protein
MKRNEGTIDRVLRVVIAAAAVAGSAAVGFATVWGIVLLAVAAIMLVTAATGFCPLYRVFGLSTCPVRAQGPERTKVTAS